MKKPTIKNRKVYIPDHDEEPHFLSKRKVRQYRGLPKAFDKKDNPYPFIVEWQLLEEDSEKKQEKQKPKV